MQEGEQGFQFTECIHEIAVGSVVGPPGPMGSGLSPWVGKGAYYSNTNKDPPVILLDVGAFRFNSNGPS